MHNVSKKMCQNTEFKRPKQTPVKLKSKFWMFIWPRNGEAPSTRSGSQAGSSSSPHHCDTSPSTGSFWLAGMMGSGSANTSSCTQLWFPHCPPQHPKAGEGRGSPTVGAPPAPSRLRLARKTCKPYLPKYRNQLPGVSGTCGELCLLVLSCHALGFKSFSPPRDVRREGGHGHTVSHPHHNTRANLGTDPL